MKQGKARVESVVLEAESQKRILKYEGEPVLTLSLRTPKCAEETPALRRIGRYYRHALDCWRTRWEGDLYRGACAELAALRERSLPFRPWEAALDFTVTYNEKSLLSLYLDAYEYTGGAHGNTVRCGDTWDLATGMPRPLPSFYPPKNHWRRAVLSTAEEEIRRRLSTGDYLYLDGWEAALVKEFDPCRFYLTAEGITIFYPLYTLAPYVEGIPTFLVEKWPVA